MVLEEEIVPMADPIEGDERSGIYPSTASRMQWSQWQLLDSILPTGGFAHSFGLESAVQSRLISSPEDLETFIIHVLDNTGGLLLPFVYTATKSPDIETWHKLDQMLNATLTNEISRKASMSQGSALFRVAASVFTEIPSLKTIRDASLGSKNISCHHAPIFGLICGLLGIDAETSQRAYLFITLRDLVSAATRLNLVGPIGASVMQHRISALAEGVLGRWIDRPAEEACQTSPLLDVVQGCHSYLFSRLFCS
ncbi:PREDICTED: urease accessory protein F isoform X2 [Tarenaya hassleriana]|nr:PREDICTED: urease accessory protein F isoform X2 [Tarenaya hassleriana]XP_010521249.1 PREDICTED: urease accessory protein F isoform X2 [Tarenaya hassleriana]